MARSKKMLGEMLIEENYISELQLYEALERQKKSGKKLGEILVELEYIS